MKNFVPRTNKAPRLADARTRMLKMVPPAEAPAETLERVAPRQDTTPEAGDVLVLRESAAHLNSFSLCRYRLAVIGEPRAQNRLFARFEEAVAHGEDLAARRRCRLLYAEQHVGPTILMDYRETRPPL